MRGDEHAALHLSWVHLKPDESWSVALEQDVVGNHTVFRFFFPVLLQWLNLHGRMQKSCMEATKHHIVKGTSVIPKGDLAQP